jgi:hypothetical protein
VQNKAHFRALHFGKEGIVFKVYYLHCQKEKGTLNWFVSTGLLTCISFFQGGDFSNGNGELFGYFLSYILYGIEKRWKSPAVTSLFIGSFVYSTAKQLADASFDKPVICFT